MSLLAVNYCDDQNFSNSILKHTIIIGIQKYKKRLHPFWLKTRFVPE